MPNAKLVVAVTAPATEVLRGATTKVSSHAFCWGDWATEMHAVNG